MKGALELNLKITNDIINPHLEDQKIQEKAKSLGFTDALKPEEAKLLYETIFSELFDEITHYMKSEEAKSICKYVEILCPIATFRSNLRERLHNQILKIYQIDVFAKLSTPEQPSSLSSWAWSLLGY